MATVGVFAAMFDENQHILCVRQAADPQPWTLPGGRLKQNEPPDQGLAREVREETGYTITISHLIGVYARPKRDDVALLFQAAAGERGLWEPTREIAQCAFFALDSLPQPMTSWVRVRIADAYARRSGLLHLVMPSGEVRRYGD